VPFLRGKTARLFRLYCRELNRKKSNYIKQLVS
jgi:hypothetical protein